jgi:hypothetical protein
MTTFTTTIAEMLTLPQINGRTDAVVNVVYVVTGIDGENTASISFSKQFTVQQGAPFTPYAQLTQNQVIGWIDSQTILNMQACVQGQLDSMIAPPVVPAPKALPW